MIKITSIILSAAAICGAVSLPASALTEKQIRECQALGKSIQVRQGEVQTMTAKRDRALEVLELTGQQWDDVEIHRMISAGHAAEADKRKAAYEVEKTEFMKLDAALQSKNRMVNQSIVHYNARCVVED
ncbi:MAG: hypothetical protein AAF768_02600 [Pseudomonadota bacterium]